METLVWVSRRLTVIAESGKCELLGGTFSTLVQASLGIICISALVIKRNNEVPQREWYVWFLDVMKQAIGSGFGHFANIFLSVFIAGTIADADECQWYCLTYVVDATAGTAINLLLLSCFEQQVQRNPGCSVMRFGEYGNPPQLSIWFPQLLVWLSIVIIAKVITLVLLFQFLNPLDRLISAIFAVFHGYPELELVTVMIIIPTVMNTIQFWVTDTFLKRQEEGEAADSELDEELIAGERGGSEEDYSYRAAAPMRGVRTAPSNSSSGRSALKIDAAALSEGIQLSSLGAGAVGGYSTLSSSSTHGGLEGDSPRSEEGGNVKVRTSPGRHRGSNNTPSIWSSLGAFLPTSITGLKAGKLERAGSDDTLDTRATGTGSSNVGSGGGSGRNPMYVSSAAHAGDGAGVAAGVSVGVSDATGRGSSGMVGKGYHSQGTVKQRTSGASTSANNSSSYSIGTVGSAAGGGMGVSVVPAGGGGGGAGSASGGASRAVGARTGSGDSAEDKALFL